MPLRCRAVAVTSPMVIDGRLDEWRGAEPVRLMEEKQWRPAASGETYGGASDLAARFYAAWDRSYLYLAVEAYDDDLAPPKVADNLLAGDCIVVAIDPNDDASQGYTPDDSELGFAYTPAGPLAWRWYPTALAGPLTAAKVAVVRQVKPRAAETGQPPIKLTYEIALPWPELLARAPQAGDVLGFDLALNDVDSGRRHGWIAWTEGVMGLKDPSRFGNLILAPPAP